MKGCFYMLILCLLATTVSAGEYVLTDVSTPSLEDCLLSPFDKTTVNSTITENNLWANSGEEFMMCFVITGLTALLGTDTRDSGIFTVGKSSNGDNGYLCLDGVYKIAVQNDATWSEWDHTNAYTWGTDGARTTAAVGAGTFNTSNGSGDDRTGAQALDSINGWNTGGAEYKGTLKDLTFFSTTSGDTLVYLFRPNQDGLDCYVTSPDHSGSFPTYLTLYTTAASGPTGKATVIMIMGEN